MSVISIPKGKTVEFHVRGAPLEGTGDILMLLEQDITITMSSTFNPVTKGTSSSAFTMLGGVLREAGRTELAGWATGQFKQLGFQVWEGTAPLSTSITVRLTMETDAYNDVVRPAMALAKICLPHEGSGGSLIPPGPSVLNAFTGDEGRAEVGEIITCYIGSYALRNVIIKRAQPTFSRHIDDKGYPISATVELGVETIFSATTSLVDDMLKR